MIRRLSVETMAVMLGGRNDSASFGGNSGVMLGGRNDSASF